MFEKSTLKHTFVPFELTKENECAQIISKNILSDKSKVLILFGDGLLCNVSKLTREIYSQYPKLIIAGGLAGDNARLEKTIVCDNKSYATQAVVALSIESDSLHIHNDYNLAWEAIGNIVRFSFTDSAKIIKSGIELSQRMLKVPVQTIFAYSCMARRRFMGENLVHDLEPLQHIAPISGFYSYSEIFTTSKSVETLNHTMTVLALSEEDEICTSQLGKNINTYSKSSQTLNALSSLISTSKEQIKEDLGLRYEKGTMELYLDSQKIKMSNLETRLFDLLFRNTHSPIDSQTIFSHIFEDINKEFNNDSIRTLIKKLRKKLPENSIENLYGGYYRLIK